MSDDQGDLPTGPAPTTGRSLTVRSPGAGSPPLSPVVVRLPRDGLASGPCGRSGDRHGHDDRQDDGLPRHALIGGRWVEGSAGTFEVRSPHSREVVNTSPDAPLMSIGPSRPPARATRLGGDATDRSSQDSPQDHRGLPRERRVDRPDGVRRSGRRSPRREEVYEYAAPSYDKAAGEVLRHRGLSLPSTQEQTNNKRLVLNIVPSAWSARSLRTTSRPISARSRWPTSSPRATRRSGSRPSSRPRAAPWWSSSSRRPVCPRSGQPGPGLRRRRRRDRRARGRRRDLLHRFHRDR